MADRGIRWHAILTALAGGAYTISESTTLPSEPGGFVVVAAAIRAIAVAAFAGALSGAVAYGVGSRLAMRLTARLASDADQGQITDAEAIVGEITAGGTIFLVLLGAAVGAIGGVVYMAARRRLTWAGPWRGVAFGALILAIFGSAVVQGHNPDFGRFGIPIVNVAMFAALFVFFGVLIAPVYDNVGCAVPSPSTSPAGVALLACQSFGVFLLVPATMLAFAILIAGGGAAALVGIAIVAMIGYVLFVVPVLFPLRQEEARTFRAVGPLALPLAVGLALDVYELSVIF